MDNTSRKEYLMKPLVRIVFCLLLAGRLPILDGCTESHLPVSDIMTEEHESVEITDPVSLKLAHQYKRHGHSPCLLYWWLVSRKRVLHVARNPLRL